MVKSAKDRLRSDLARPLNGTMERRILAKSGVCSRDITISGVQATCSMAIA